MKKPITNMGKSFDKDLVKSGITINEIDGVLTEKKYSLKRKIFSLPKMEALVFSDPKLSIVYEEMADEGREKYGYHYNETIMNIIFNDYVLNSPKYLQKYKMTVPPEKKKERRDKYGIEKLRKDLGKKEKSTPKNETQEMGSFSRYGKGVGNIDSNQGDIFENKKHVSLESAFEEANKISKEEGVVQHVNKINNDNYVVSDWYDEETTVGSFENGKKINETMKTSNLNKNKNTTNQKNFTGEKFSGKSIEKKPTNEEETEIDESTTTGGAGDYQYAGPSVWAKGGKPMMRKPIWKGGTVIGESQYLTNPDSFKKYLNFLNEQEKFESILNNITENSDFNKVKLLLEDFNNKINEEKQKNKSMKKNVNEHHLNTREEKIGFISKNMDVGSIEKTLNKLSNDEIDRIYGALEKKMGLVKEDEMSIVREPKTDSMSAKPDSATDIGRSVEVGTSVNEGDDFIRTKDDLRGFVKQHKERTGKAPDLATLLSMSRDEAVYTLAITVANRLLPLPWDHLPDVNSMWDYIDSKNGMKKEDFIESVKEACNNRLAEEGFGLDDLPETKNIIPIKENEPIEKNTSDWVGTDANLEISLFEYGVVAKQPEDRDYEDEWFVLYNVGENRYDTGWIRESELDDIIMGKEWASDEDVKSFLDTMGKYPPMGKENWLALPFIQKISNLIGYWGYENIMGTSYHTISKEEALKMVEDNTVNEIDELIKEGDKILSEIGFYKKNKNMNEEKKTPSQVSKERIGNENKKNFSSDLQNSGTKEAIEAQKDLQHKDQQTEIDNPKKFSEDIEKDVLKTSGGGGLENKGDSTADGKHIPKRNHTDDEMDEVDLTRKGMQDWQYDNLPSKRFEERMKDGMGEELYKQRQEKMKRQEKAPTYNKDTQPVFDGDEKNQYNKNKLSEAILTGLYINDFGKRKLVNFKLNNTISTEKIDESWVQISFEGMGNSYTNIGELNEEVVGKINEGKYYLNEKTNEVFFIKNKKILAECENKKIGLNEEQINKMKRLSNHNTKTFIDTRSTKSNRGF